ncbi:MAG TPA: DUF1800 family protein, partial [Gemmatimonadales bacterium]
MHRFAAPVALAALLVALPFPRGGTDPAPGAAGADSADRARALHLLGRITYGPRPGDVDRVLAMGIDKYLDQQLHPDRIADTVAERAVQAFPVLKMSLTELARREQRVRQENQRRQRQTGDSMRPDPANNPPPPNSEAGQLRRLISGFQQAAVVRAALSDRQLYEVMVDFWTNHFNIYMAKGIDRVLMPSYIEETIRPNALGTFEALLTATAKSPAMMFYLDNAESVTPGAQAPRAQGFGRRGFAPGFGFPPNGRG